jgi:hypothetical protein
VHTSSIPVNIQLHAFYYLMSIYHARVAPRCIVDVFCYIVFTDLHDLGPVSIDG